MSTTTMTTTATAVELESLPQGMSSVSHRDVHPVTASRTRLTEPDPVIEASRIADSAVPDGGYAWVVIVACAVVTWWCIGTTYCWGVIQAALVEEGLSNPATLSFVGSLSAALISICAIVNSKVMRMLGTRWTTMLGVSCMGLSEILSGFAVNNLAGLFMTGGVLMGFGMSLCFMSISVIPAQYFSRKRGLANGVVFAGGGIGGAVTSIVSDAFLQKYGPAWTFRFLGLATIVTGLPAAWLIRERTSLRSGGFVEWRLFKDTKFLLVFAAGGIGTFPLFVPPFFLPLYSKSLGLSSSTSAILVAAFTFSSGVGRIVSGFCCDLIGSVNTLFVALMLNAITMVVLWPASTSLAPLTAFAILNGASNGGFFSTMPTVVGNVFGSQRVAVAMGMVVTSWAGGYLMGAPIAGYLLGAYGGAENGLQAFRPAMFYAGALALVSAGFVLAVRLKISRRLIQKI